MADKQFQDFKSFYPFYLSQHQNLVCRRLHYIGSGLIVLLLLFTVFNQQWWQFLLIPVIGYGFAWVGHFAFEKNRPATFEYPIYSFIADWVMFAQMLKKIFSTKR